MNERESYKRILLTNEINWGNLLTRRNPWRMNEVGNPINGYTLDGARLGKVF